MSIEAAIRGAEKIARARKVERVNEELKELIKNLRDGQIMKEDFPEETRLLLKNLL